MPAIALIAAIAAAQEPVDRKGVLEGRAVHALTGEPVARARLVLTMMTPPGTRLHERPAPREAASGADGHFRFEGLAPGRYYLRASKAGFSAHFYNPRPGTPRPAPVEVAAGQKVTRIEMRMLPQAMIGGRILDEDGEPVQRAAVAIHRLEYGSLGRRELQTAGNMYTSDTGEFRFPALSPGRYYLWARHPGELMDAGVARARDPKAEIEFDYAPVFYPDSPDLEGALPIDVEAGLEAEGIDFRQRRTPAFRVRGRVAGHDQPGAPLSLMLMRQGADAYASLTGRQAQVGTGGTFEFAGIPPGTYDLLPLPREGLRAGRWATTVEIGKRDVEGVVVAESQIPAAALTCELELEGEDLTEPIRGALSLMLRPLDWPPWHYQGIGHTDSRRTFAIENIRPGRYWPDVSGRPQPDVWLKSILLDGREVGEEGLPVQPGGSSRLTLLFALHPGEISGLVVDGDGEPVPGAVVTLVPARAAPTRSDLYPSTAAGPDGRFALQHLAPGAYYIYAWDDIPPGAHRDPEYLKPYSSRATKIEVQRGGRHELNLKLIPRQPGGL